MTSTPARQDIRYVADANGWTLADDSVISARYVRGDVSVWVFFTVRGAANGAAIARDGGTINDAKDAPARGKRETVLAWLMEEPAVAEVAADAAHFAATVDGAMAPVELAPMPPVQGFSASYIGSADPYDDGEESGTGLEWTDAPSERDQVTEAAQAAKVWNMFATTDRVHGWSADGVMITVSYSEAGQITEAVRSGVMASTERTRALYVVVEWLEAGREMADAAQDEDDAIARAAAIDAETLAAELETARAQLAKVRAQVKERLALSRGVLRDANASVVQLRTALEETRGGSREAILARRDLQGRLTDARTLANRLDARVDELERLAELV